MARTRRSRNSPKIRVRKVYPSEALDDAVTEARRSGNIREAAKRHGVPFSTVHRHLRTPPKGDKPGPSTLLSPDEEARFEQWALYMARAGFPISETDLTHTVKDYADKIRQKRDIPASFPSKNWANRFLQRHPSLKKKFTTNLTRSGANVTEDLIRMWFSEVEEILVEEDIALAIFDNPKRIFNFDESGFQLTSKPYKALCDRSAENAYVVHNNSDKESFTALFGCNADGQLTPPMILYPGKRISREIAESIPKGWSVGVSDEGWETSKTFYEYFVNDLFQWLVNNEIEFPIVVFLDGHRSHISVELTEFCTQHQIILISLYPNSTRILQPLDRLFFGPFKKIWCKVLRQFQLGSTSARVTKLNFAKLLKTALDNFSNSKECLMKAFRICGLCPWNVDMIDFSLLPTNASKPKEPSAEVDEVTTNVLTETYENEHQLQLNYVELGLQCDQLSRFLENWKRDFWYGPSTELALFNFWKCIKDKAEGMMFTEPLEESRSNTMEFIELDDYGECSILPETVITVNAELDSEASVNFTSDGDDCDPLIDNIRDQHSGVDSVDPFDDVLVWPRVSATDSTQRKRRHQEHIPSVATSDKWRQWYDKKDSEKKKIEEAKQARIENRNLIKQKKAEEKLLKSARNKENYDQNQGQAKKKTGKKP